MQSDLKLKHYTKQTVYGFYFPVFIYAAAVDFIQQHVHTGSVQLFILKLQ